MEEPKPKITAAVVSCRPILISRCLKSLCSQTLPSSLFQILVVADYAVPAFESKQIRWILNVPKSIAANRNIALREANTGMIAFTDDDCVAHPDWLKNGLAYLEQHPDEIGVQGQIVVPSAQAQKANYKEAARLQRPLYQTSNIFYRTKAVLEVGGFDEHFVFQREDIDLGFTLIERGYKIGYASSALVEHPLREDEYWDLIHTAFRKRYDPLLQKKHPKLFRQFLGRILPGSFIFMLILWGLSLIMIPFAPKISVLPVMLGSLVLTFRKLQGTRLNLKWILAMFVNYLIAPLLAGLVIGAGKIRY